MAAALRVRKQWANMDSILCPTLMKFPLADKQVEACQYCAFSLRTSLQKQHMIFFKKKLAIVENRNKDLEGTVGSL